MIEIMHIRRTECPHLPVGRSQVLTDQSMDRGDDQPSTIRTKRLQCVCMGTQTSYQLEELYTFK